MKSFYRHKKFSNGKKRGAAMVSALFVIAIVLILGAAFIMMALGESKSTRSDKTQILALQLANSGVELLLNYMQSPKVHQSGVLDYGVWERSSQPGHNYQLAAYNDAGNPMRKDYLTDETVSFTVEKTPEAIAGGYNFWNPSMERFEYLIKITPERQLGEYRGAIEIILYQKVYEPGQPVSYTVICTGKVYRAGETAQNTVAARQIEARFREFSALDWLYFFQNHRAYDIPATLAAMPNPDQKTDNMVGIPDGFSANGDIKIDGGSDFALNTAGSMHFFGDNFSIAGNIYFSSTSSALTSDTGVDFTKVLNKAKYSQDSIGMPKRENYMTADLNGDGTVSGIDVGSAASAAAPASLPAGKISGYFKCGDNKGLPSYVSDNGGPIGHSKAQNPTEALKWYSPDYADSSGSKGTHPKGIIPKIGVAELDMTMDYPADVEFDGSNVNKAPGFATYKVVFSNGADNIGRVTVTKVTPYTRVEAILLNNEPVNNIANGLLYFEGGNVDVQGTCNGKLSVVSAEHSTREAYAYDVKTADGASIRQYSHKEYNVQTNLDPEYQVPGKIEGKSIASVSQVYSKETDYKSENGNSNHIYVPYSDTSRVPDEVYNRPCYVDGTYDSTTGTYTTPGRWVWRGSNLNAEDAEGKLYIKNYNDGKANIGTFRDAEKEGNIVISGDIKYPNGSLNSALGLIAKNFVLINDDRVWEKNPKGEQNLNVRAAIISFDHSLQLDYFNMASKGDGTAKRIAGPAGGTISFNGSVISQFGDVEGYLDPSPIGYTKQEMHHDSNLTRVVPPHFPIWDYEQLAKLGSPSNPIILRYIILGYQDKGALGINVK